MDIFDNANLEFAPSISLKLMPTDVSHQQIAFLGYVELKVTSRISKLAKSGGLMIDVGANYGYYSCIWVAARTSNLVLAYLAPLLRFAAGPLWGPSYHFTQG